MYNFLHELVPWVGGGDDSDDGDGDREDGTDELTWPVSPPTIEVSHSLTHPLTDADVGFVGYDTANDAGVAVVEGPGHVTDGLAWVARSVVDALAEGNETRDVPIQYLGFQPAPGALHVFPLEAYMPAYSERRVAEFHGEDRQVGVPLDVAADFTDHSTAG